jgi:hypothetical protein
VTAQPEQNCKDRTARTGQPGWGNLWQDGQGVNSSPLHNSNFEKQRKENLLNKIGESRDRSQRLGPDSTLLPPGRRDERGELEREAHIAIIPEYLEDILCTEFNVDDEMFLELLIICIRSDVTSYQLFLVRMQDETVKKVMSQLDELTTL